MGKWFGRSFLFSLLVVAVVVATPAAWAQGDGEPIPDGPVFLIVSLADDGFDTEFDLEEGDEGEEGEGSPTIIVNIGTLQGGGSLRDVTFLSAALSTIPLPQGLTFEDLDGNLATIVGSYQTDDEESHVVTPEDPALIEDGIPSAIQQAIFFASPALVASIDPSNPDGGPFMTTKEIAEFIGSEFELDAEEIARFLFGGATALDLIEGDGDVAPLCEAEGELFPHDPDEPVFVFGIAFDEDGALTYDACFPADVEVKESSVNLKKKGTVSIAIYDSDTLETDDIVDVTILGVPADKIQHSSKKATAQFDLEDLADVLTSDTVQVLVVAELEDETCFAGIAEINVK